jgi:ribonuclease BN (tRNA processing enzyme)
MGLDHLDAVWISHMHPDHCGDLLAVSNWLLNRSGLTAPLPIYGPPGWFDRVTAFLPTAPELLLKHIEVHDHVDNDVNVVGDLLLVSRSVRHSVPTFGVRISHNDHVMAFSGDSGPCDALDALAHGADLFLCEAGAAAPYAESPQAGHCTPEDAALTAQRAGADLLLLTHLSPDLSPDAARQRSLAHHRRVELAVPGAVYPLGPQGGVT